MALTTQDFNHIDTRISRALEKNNKILIDGIAKYIHQHCDTAEIKKQLNKLTKRLDTIESRLEISS